MIENGLISEPSKFVILCLFFVALLINIKLTYNIKSIETNIFYYNVI